MKKIKLVKKHWIQIAVFIFIVLLTRIIFYSIESPDYLIYLKNWYQDIIKNGRIESLGLQIGNYSPPYILLLTLGTYITSNSLLIVKIIAFIFDIIMAIYVCLIVKQFKTNNYIKALMYTLILPGVILNSAVLGQCDSIYTTFVIMFIYYILKDKNKLALFCYGIALAFKLQAIFVAPIILYLIITKKIKFLDIIYILIGFMVLMLPSMIYGKSIIDILQIYLDQTKQYSNIVRSAPNIYSFLNLNYVEIGTIVKYILTVIGITVSIFISVHGVKISKYKFSTNHFLVKIMLLTVMVPYLLPGMMDRYFYMANILLLINFYVTNRPTKYGKRIVVFASIAYSIPVITINFLSYNDYMLNLSETFVVSKFASVINIFIVLILIDRHFLNENKELYINETKMK